jgi:hypothetical protein
MAERDEGATETRPVDSQEPTGRASDEPGQGTSRPLEIRLPFLTITRGGTPTPATSTAGVGARRLEQMAFYGGAAALAAVGVIDWPVAALIAAGTYIAQKSRGSSGARSRHEGAARAPGGSPESPGAAEPAAPPSRRSPGRAVTAEQ